MSRAQQNIIHVHNTYLIRLTLLKVISAHTDSSSSLKSQVQVTTLILICICECEYKYTHDLCPKKIMRYEVSTKYCRIQDLSLCIIHIYINIIIRYSLIIILYVWSILHTHPRLTQTRTGYSIPIRLILKAPFYFSVILGRTVSNNLLYLMYLTYYFHLLLLVVSDDVYNKS